MIPFRKKAQNKRRVPMVRRLLPLLALAALAAGPAGAVEQGELAPQWRGTDFEGHALAFPDLIEGRPTVVVFWATWCSYCKAFMPYLKQIQADYGAQRINVLTINAKEDGEGDPRSYLANLDFPMVAVRDGDAIAAAYGVEYIPGLMVIDGQGLVAYRRAWTELPAGDTVARFWSRQVRRAIDQLIE
jgi:thiol-disulfide isomerase/thioredoxin